MFFDRSTSGNTGTAVVAVRGDPDAMTSHHGDSDDSLPVGPDSLTPSIRQFLFYLQSDLRALTRTETVNAVIAVTPAEVERVGRTVAKLRGRYLAQVLDLGHANRPPLTDSEIGQLKRSRESYQEVDRGFAELRAAIETGEVPLEGVRRD